MNLHRDRRVSSFGFRILAGVLWLWLCLGAAGAAPVEPASSPVAVPPRNSLVTDAAGVLTSAQQAALRKKLDEAQTLYGAQVAVLIVPTTGAEGIEAYAARVFARWQLGSAQDDDGILILVALQDRRMRIEVGQGLEGRVTDLAASRIIDTQMKPHFEQADYHSGITAAVEALIERLRGDGGIDERFSGDGAAVEATAIPPADDVPGGSGLTAAGQVFIAVVAALLCYGSYRWRAMRFVTAGLMAVGLGIWIVARLVGGDMGTATLMVIGGSLAALFATLIVGVIGFGMRAGYRRSGVGFMVQWLIVLGITGFVAYESEDWILVAVAATLSMLFIFAGSLGNGTGGSRDNDNDDDSSSSSSSSDRSSSSSSSGVGGSSSGGGASGSW